MGDFLIFLSRAIGASFIYLIVMEGLRKWLYDGEQGKSAVKNYFKVFFRDIFRIAKWLGLILIVFYIAIELTHSGF